MKYLTILLVLLATPSFSQTVNHTINWENGVNKKLVKDWVVSLDKISKANSTTYIAKKYGGKDKLHRVGHRDVIIWIPESTDLKKDLKLVLWFHGHWGFVPKRTFENRTLKQFSPLVNKSNFILVIPEMPWSVHTSTPTKRNSLLWTKPGDFLKFINQIKSILIKHARTPEKKLGNIDYRIVGHSAGGSTIKRLGINGDLCRLKPSMVVWSDSSYGRWLKLAWDGCLSKNRDITVKVFVAKGDSPWIRATQFMGEFQGPVENLELHVMKKPKWSHKLIGDNIVELSSILD